MSELLAYDAQGVAYRELQSRIKLLHQIKLSLDQVRAGGPPLGWFYVLRAAALGVFGGGILCLCLAVFGTIGVPLASAISMAIGVAFGYYAYSRKMVFRRHVDDLYDFLNEYGRCILFYRNEWNKCISQAIPVDCDLVGRWIESELAANSEIGGRLAELTGNSVLAAVEPLPRAAGKNTFALIPGL